VDTGVERLERQGVLEVDIGDQRNRGVGNDVRQRGGGHPVRHGQTDDFATGIGQLLDLAKGGLRIARVAGGHRLHDDRVVTADLDTAQIEHTRLATGSDEHGTNSLITE
jgi:hypothetical protein